MYAVKVSYKGEVRRLQLTIDNNNGSSFAKFSATLQSIYPNLPRHFSLTWKDEENDTITVSSDLELQEAVRVMQYQHGMLKFTVEDASAASAPQGPHGRHPHCFKRGGGCAPFPHHQEAHPFHQFGRHPCGRGFGGQQRGFPGPHGCGPREAIFHLFGRPVGPVPGLGPRQFPPAWATAAAAAASEHSETLFGIPLEAVAEVAEALALELSEVIQKGEEEAAAKKDVSTATTSAAQKPEGLVVHTGVTCDVCGKSPITGPRYKCTVRHNYDVCAACYESQLQPYPMLKIVTNGGVGTIVHPGASVNRDLNDEDAGLQAAISESYATSAAATSVPAGDVPPPLLRSTISETSATVDDEEGVEDVYSEGGFSVVSAPTAEDFSLTADREAALAAAAVTAVTPAAPTVSGTEVWAKELKLLSDMGFTEASDLIPLLQQHIATPASATASNETSVEGIQKVIGTLLFR